MNKVNAVSNSVEYANPVSDLQTQSVELDPKTVAAQQQWLRVKGAPTHMGVYSSDFCGGLGKIVATDKGYYFYMPFLARYVKLVGMPLSDFWDGEIQVCRRSNPNDGTICARHVHSNGDVFIIGYFNFKNIFFTSPDPTPKKPKKINFVPSNKNKR